jgi:hypothetical protein
MSDGLEKLKSMGAQNIYEQTHISKEHVQAILHESFEGLNKVQFLGFISILEREYNVDLSSVRTSGLGYLEQMDKDKTHNDSDLFVSPKERKNNNSSSLIVILIVIALIAAISFYFYNENTQNDVKSQIDNSVIESAKEKVEENNSIKTTIELNATISEENNESNISKEVESTLEDTVKPEIEDENKIVQKSSLKVFPRSKVWMGYIEISTNKHHQKVFSNSFELDAKTDWLLVFGHGDLNIELNGEIQKYSSQNTLRFLYKEGELKPINLKEFKSFNKGKGW